MSRLPPELDKFRKGQRPDMPPFKGAKRDHTMRWYPSQKEEFAGGSRATCPMCKEMCQATNMEADHKLPIERSHNIGINWRRPPNQLLCKQCHNLKTKCEYNWVRARPGGREGPRPARVSPKTYKERLREMEEHNYTEYELGYLLQPEHGLSIQELIGQGGWNPRKYAEQRVLAEKLSQLMGTPPNGQVYPVMQPQLLRIPKRTPKLPNYTQSNKHNNLINYYQSLISAPPSTQQKIDEVVLTPALPPLNRGTRFYPEFATPPPIYLTRWSKPTAAKLRRSIVAQRRKMRVVKGAQPKQWHLYIAHQKLTSFEFDGRRGNIVRVEIVSPRRAHVYRTPHGGGAGRPTARSAPAR